MEVFEYQKSSLSTCHWCLIKSKREMEERNVRRQKRRSQETKEDEMRGRCCSEGDEKEKAIVGVRS